MSNVSQPYEPPSAEELAAVESAGTCSDKRGRRRLTTETVQGTALALEGVDDIEGGDRLALGVLGVRNSVTDNTLEEGLQDTTGLFVDHCDGVSDASTRR
jgi:hypothetical protein